MDKGLIQVVAIAIADSPVNWMDYQWRAVGAIEAYEQHLADSGLVIVPREATNKMQAHGDDFIDENITTRHGFVLDTPAAWAVWDTMIQAAQGSET